MGAEEVPWKFQHQNITPQIQIGCENSSRKTADLASFRCERPPQCACTCDWTSNEPPTTHWPSKLNLALNINKAKCRCLLTEELETPHQIITKLSHRNLDFELAQHHFCRFRFQTLWRTQNTIGHEFEANANMFTKDSEHPHTCTRNSSKIDNPQSQLRNSPKINNPQSQLYSQRLMQVGWLASVKTVRKKIPKTWH